MKKTSLVLLILSMACSPTRFVKTLDKNEHAANISLGGPLIGFSDATIPIPFLTGTYGYGIDSATTGFASLNMTSALFQNFQTEIGFTRRLLKPLRWRPGISVAPAFQFIYHDKNAKKLYPTLDLNAYWVYNKRNNYCYLGTSNWFELSGKKAHDQKQTEHWTFVPMLGHVHTMKFKWELLTEVKLIAPGRSNQNIVVDYKTPLGKKGAFGVYVGITRKF
jgi:hypothetical protein